MSTPKLILALVVLMALVMPAGAPPSSAASLQGVEIKAHRGGSVAYGAPEESLKLLSRAAAAGVDWVEFDVVYTKQGTAVLQHSDAVGGGATGSATCTHAGAAIHLMTDAQVQQVRCGGEPIATLAQVLQLLRGYPKTKIDLEVKAYTGQSLASKQDWMRRTLVTTAGFHSRMAISTFHWRQLAPLITRAAPKARFVALEYAKLIRLAKNKAYANARLAKKLGADGFGYAVTSADVGLVRFLRALGLGVELYGFTDARFGEQVRFALYLGQRVLSDDNPPRLTALVKALRSKVPVARQITTSLKAKTVLRTKLTRSKRRYPQVFGSAGTVPTRVQNQLSGVRLKIRVTAKKSGGLVEVSPRNSRVGRDGVRFKIRKGTHTYRAYVSPGDLGDLRVRTTRTVQILVAVTGYRTARFG